MSNSQTKRGRPAKPKEVEAWKDIAGYEGHCLRGKTKTAHGNHWRYV